MTWYFLDTSALVKRYHVERGTSSVDALCSDKDVTLVISRLALVELASALALKVRTGELSSIDYLHAHKRFLADLAMKAFLVPRFLVAHFRDAEKMVHTHSTTRRLRTLDAIQLATAKHLMSQGRMDVFVTADATLLSIAADEGLQTLNPELLS